MWRAVMNKFNPEASSNGQVDDSSSRGGAPAVPELPFKLAFVEAEAINNYGSNGHHHSSNGSIDNGAALTRALSTDNGEVNTSTKFYFTSATVPIKVSTDGLGLSTRTSVPCLSSEYLITALRPSFRLADEQGAAAACGRRLDEAHRAAPARDGPDLQHGRQPRRAARERLGRGAGPGRLAGL